MKFNSLKLHPFAATRLIMGLSQRQMAELLGISKAAVALAEIRLRLLPGRALLKMAELQIKVEAVLASGVVDAYKKNNTKPMTTLSTGASEPLSIGLKYFTMKLLLMRERYVQLQDQLRLLDIIIEQEQDEPGNGFLFGLRIHRLRLIKRLSTCDHIKQTSLQNKLNLVEAKEKSLTLPACLREASAKQGRQAQKRQVRKVNGKGFLANTSDLGVFAVRRQSIPNTPTNRLSLLNTQHKHLFCHLTIDRINLTRNKIGDDRKQPPFLFQRTRRLQRIDRRYLFYLFYHKEEFVQYFPGSFITRTEYPHRKVGGLFL